MKYFREPTGQFAIVIPTTWQYKNVLREEPEASPYSFGTYEGDKPWGFQISCYPLNEGMRRHIERKTMIVQPANTPNLDFIERLMEKDGCDYKLWACIVEDHFFSIKFIYETKDRESELIKAELENVDKALSTLVFISPDNRERAIAVDRYDKFIASLAASFDLKQAAIEKNCFIEAMIITASQIDAYLRMAIVLQRQLASKSYAIDLNLIYQPKEAKGNEKLSEHNVYDLAQKEGIINDEIHQSLKTLYKRRNRVVHQYIISDLKTNELLEIAMKYEFMHNDVCQILGAFEVRQGEEGVGIYANGKYQTDEVPEDYLKMLHSWVNDKHLSKERNRNVG